MQNSTNGQVFLTQDGINAIKMAWNNILNDNNKSNLDF